MLWEPFFRFACIPTTDDTFTAQISDILTAKVPRGHHDGIAKFDFSRHPLLFNLKILTSLWQCRHCLSTRGSVLVGRTLLFMLPMDDCPYDDRVCCLYSAYAICLFPYMGTMIVVGCRRGVGMVLAGGIYFRSRGGRTWPIGAPEGGNGGKFQKVVKNSA